MPRLIKFKLIGQAYKDIAKDEFVKDLNIYDF